MNEDKIIKQIDALRSELKGDIADIALNVHEMKNTFVTKNDFSEFRNQVQTTQDEMITILRRLDQERIFTTAWVGRIEKEVEEHTREIKNIKQALKIQ